MKRKLKTYLLIVSFLLLLPYDVWAAKPRPPRGSSDSQAKTPIKRTYSGGRGVKTSVRFRSDRLGLLINFGDFGDAVLVTYSLTYTADGIPQGVRGTVNPETAGEQRELLFGTCSAGVCRYHSNITEARLVIDSKLSSGLTIRKPYRIKV